MKHCVIAGTGN